MTTLTAANVNKVFIACLFQEGDEVVNPVIVEGVLADFGFHPGRLAEHKAEIKELLDQLPDEFKIENGGGWSFLNACVTKDGDQWGEHIHIEQLVVLGIATNQARWIVSRSMWKMFPGGMPYFGVGVIPLPAAAPIPMPAPPPT